MSALPPSSGGQLARLRILVRGAVQGVGFRPFVFRLAEEFAVKGWVNNSAQGVWIEVEGAPSVVNTFLYKLQSDKPPRSSIHSLEHSWLDPIGYKIFEVRKSDESGPKTAFILPDIATCDDCLREIFDPDNRRYFYPFTNCTNCGPRFTIIEHLPYDRANTSMRRFEMCAACRAEYEDPADRRFHAQPNACPVCGPHLELWDQSGKLIQSRRIDAIDSAVAQLRAGKIVAAKGIGGFHLLVDPCDPLAVRRLRERKHREEKPFAVMFPHLTAVCAVCELSPIEERLLSSPESPIVLLRQKRVPNPRAPALAEEVAPGNPNLGVMLPYSPMHHLLLKRFGSSLIATSGNLSDEPICTDERDACSRLSGIADNFLVHNRPIVRHADDSVVRVVGGREMVLRRARGFAPLPIPLPGTFQSRGPVLAVGAHLKSTIAVSVGQSAFISQHLGDLETEPAYRGFVQVVSDFQKLFEITPGTVVADLHPDYLSTKFAEEVSSAEARSGDRRPTLLRVQHHIAHVLSCMAENELRPPALAVAWDGTGYGLDGTIWGGEFFVVSHREIKRVAHLRSFRLPGGEVAIKEPRRSAFGLIYELGAEAIAGAEAFFSGAFSGAERKSHLAMLERNINSPVTSSVGRLFDAIASLIGVRHRVRHEGQAAMELEFAAEKISTTDAYTVEVREPTEKAVADRQRTPKGGGPWCIDWAPVVAELLQDRTSGASKELMAAKFHNSLAAAVVEVAIRVGIPAVVLSGGSIQNRYLTEKTIEALRTRGFRPYWHQRIPPNDGGISLGQIVASSMMGECVR